VVALPDIRAAAAQHLLVLPREHIPNVSSLTAADAQLGEVQAGVQC
jgi:diadenosine tetraphosphate (Ap4A) HIT family hydrolase